MVSFPAIAAVDEVHYIQTPYGMKTVTRKAGEALHPAREPLETLMAIKQTLGEYNFAGQYQQSPVPAGGGLVKTHWLQTYQWHECPAKFDRIVQSWDTASKMAELNDYSVCTTWGLKEKKIYLLDVLRRRMNFPELKHAVREQYMKHKPERILIEDKSSGTQLIQELVHEGLYQVRGVKTVGDKKMRLNAQTGAFENGKVFLPAAAAWLAEYVHELTSFPAGKFDDQVDSTSQALAWITTEGFEPALLTYYRQEAERFGYRPMN